MAEVRIQFETDNAAFVDYPHGGGNYDEEIRFVIKQVEEFLLGDMRDEKLRDSNGNTIGRVWISTTLRPNGK